MNIQVPESVFVYGGLNTSEKSLRALGTAIVAQGFAAPEAPIRVFTLGEAGRDPHAATAAEGGLAVVHSMGGLITKRMVEEEVRPEGLIVLNRPMPSSRERLVAGGAVRLGRHFARSAVGPHAAAHWQIVKDTRESALDWGGNIGRIPEVVSFSGDEWMGILAARGARVAAVISRRKDEFGAAYRQPGTAEGVGYVDDLIGCHDAAEYAPEWICRLVAELGLLPRLQ